MLSRYLQRPPVNKNESDNFTLVQLDGYTIEGIVDIDGITCSDNVQTTQFLGSAITVSERGSRNPYSFSINIVIMKTQGGRTIDEQVTEILKLREKNEPISIYWTGLTKYGIEKLNILDYSADEYKEYVEINLNCDEVIEYDIKIKDQTPEEAFFSQYTPGGGVIEEANLFADIVGDL